MTGLQVANNLSRNRLRWVKSSFVYREKGVRPRYCVLGMKLHEAGVSDELLKNIGDLISVEVFVNPIGDGDEEFIETKDFDVPEYESFDNLDELVNLNDACSSKRELIKKLRSRDWRKTNFDIEGYRKEMLQAQREVEKARSKKK